MQKNVRKLFTSGTKGQEENMYTQMYTQSPCAPDSSQLFGVEMPHKGKTNVLNGCLTS